MFHYGPLWNEHPALAQKQGSWHQRYWIINCALWKWALSPGIKVLPRYGRLAVSAHITLSSSYMHVHGHTCTHARAKEPEGRGHWVKPLGFQEFTRGCHTNESERSGKSETHQRMPLETRPCSKSVFCNQLLGRFDNILLQASLFKLYC